MKSLQLSEKHKKERAIEILSNAFDSNLSVNLIVKQDEKRIIRVKRLIDYAYRVCNAYGKVVFSDDGHACALVLLPHMKRVNFKSLYWDLKLLIEIIGISNVLRVLKRESLIKKQHPGSPFYYLWFIGVKPEFKGLGIGTALLRELIADADAMALPLYLETSEPRNILWYQKFEINIFYEVDIGYNLFFLKR